MHIKNLSIIAQLQMAMVAQGSFAERNLHTSSIRFRTSLTQLRTRLASA